MKIIEDFPQIGFFSRKILKSNECYKKLRMKFFTNEKPVREKVNLTPQ